MKYICRGCGISEECILDVDFFEFDRVPKICPYEIWDMVQWEVFKED